MIGLIVCSSLAEHAGMAQSATSSASADAKLRITSTLQVVVVSAVDFGAVGLGTTSPIRLDPNTGTVSPGGLSGTVGQFRIQGGNSEEVILSYTSSHPQNSRLLFSPTVVGARTGRNQSSAKALASNTRVRLSSVGRYHVWVGGNVDISSASVGDYTGSFTLTATYIF